MTYLAAKNIAKPNKKRGYKCCWCGIYDAEYDLPFSDNFVGYPYLKEERKGLCKYCYAFVSEQKFRKRSWIATEGKVDFVKQKEAYSYLFNPDDNAWFVHITSSGQKQSWLNAIHSVNFSKQRFAVSFEKYDSPIFFTRSHLLAMSEVAKKLREQKITKTEMKCGEFKPKTYEKAIDGDFENLLSEAKEYACTPQWEVVVYGTE